MRAVLILLAGASMLLGSAAHALAGWPPMEAALMETGAGPDLQGALSVGWYWGSAAMLAFGVITLAAGMRQRRGDPSLRPALLAVAGCYLAFGLAAFFGRGHNPHFLYFIVTGLLAGLPCLGGSRGQPEPARPGAS